MLEVSSYYAETVLMLVRYEILAKPTSYTMIEKWVKTTWITLVI